MEWTYFVLRENLHFALGAFFLLLGVATDILWRRVPNILFFSMLIGSLLFCFIEEGFSWNVFIHSLLLILLAFGLGFVFFIFRILGAGDVKLFMAVAPLGSYALLFYTFVTSFIWGALLGLSYILIWGKWKSFLKNLNYIYKKAASGSAFLLKNKIQNLERAFEPAQSEEESLNYIPYTVAIFLAYLSCIGIYP